MIDILLGLLLSPTSSILLFFFKDSHTKSFVNYRHTSQRLDDEMFLGLSKRLCMAEPLKLFGGSVSC